MPGEPDSPDTVSFIRTLPEAESFELLDAAIVGRVGFVAMRALVGYEWMCREYPLAGAAGRQALTQDHLRVCDFLCTPESLR